MLYVFVCVCVDVKLHLETTDGRRLRTYFDFENIIINDWENIRSKVHHNFAPNTDMFIALKRIKWGKAWDAWGCEKCRQ
jgi:hypothetical protein